MASASTYAGPSLRRGPLELAKSLVDELFEKELAAHLSPSDEAKNAAFAGLRARLPVRQAGTLLPLAGAEPEELVDRFAHDIVMGLWTSLREHPRVAQVTSSFLETSLVIGTVCSVFDAIISGPGHSDIRLRRGSYLMMAAIGGIGGGRANNGPPASAESTAHLLTLLQWWADEICSKRLRIADPWGSCMLGTHRVWPLHAIAGRGLVTFVPLALEKGCPVNGDLDDDSSSCPLFVAFESGHLDVADALLAHGADLTRAYNKDGWPVVMRIFAQEKPQMAFLTKLLREQPDIIAAHTSEKATNSCNLLLAALLSDVPAVVDLVLSSAAAQGRGDLWQEDMSLLSACIYKCFSGPDVQSLKLLITKGRIFENWREKFNEDMLDKLSLQVATLAISAYPSNPRYGGDPADLVKHAPRGFECFELVSSAGFVRPFTSSGQNVFLARLYRGKHCILEEKHALALLQRLHAGGYDILTSRVAEDESALRLSHEAVAAGHRDVLDWFLSTVHIPEVTSTSARQLLFGLAISYKRMPCALLMLEKYGVSASYPEEGLTGQPVVNFMRGIDTYSDAEATKFLSVVAERSPSLFGISCFSGLSTATVDAAYDEGRGQRVLWNPVFELAFSKKPHALECLLKKNLPGVAMMVHRPVLVQQSGASKVLMTAAQGAASRGSWECLSLLLRHTDARVTDTFSSLASTVDLVHRASRTADSPPRPLVALVEAHARSERAAEGGASAASAAVDATTNAFEMPAPKALTDREAKKKAKKKAAKKKAKAKKRAAASAGAGGAGTGGAAGAGAGAAGADTSESDDDSSDDDYGATEEPAGNLVDSRNAPSLDALLEQMGLKEKEEEKE